MYPPQPQYPMQSAIALELQFDAKCLRALLQDPQQIVPSQPRKAMPTRAHHLIAIKHVDAIPVVKAALDRVVALGILVAEVFQRLIGKHHAKPERVRRTVPLDDSDPIPRIGFLHQDRQVQTCRTTTETDDVHGH